MGAQMISRQAGMLGVVAGVWGVAAIGWALNASAVIPANGAPDWCDTQFPSSTVTRVGIPTELLRGQVGIEGVTSQAGPAPGLQAQLGYGPDGSDPAVAPGWTWIDASFSGDVGNYDEYAQTLTIDAPGVYDYAFRYTYGGSTCYGDTDGSANGYDPGMAGHLVVLPEANCPKWQQAPDCQYGLSVTSYEDLLPTSTNLAADDFVSDGRPITGLKWWGSYKGYGGAASLTNPPSGLRPVAFEVRWYTDVPTGQVAAWSMPGTLITNVVATLQDYGISGDGTTGVVSEGFYCTTDLAWAQAAQSPVFQHTYEYNLRLPQPWLEQEGRIYWLAVRALYEVPVTFPWGWKTTPVSYNWNDDAVYGASNAWAELHYPPTGWTTITNHPYRGQSANLAFELITDQCPRRCKKWAQPPDLTQGSDMPSWRHASQPPSGYILRADDFISDGRRITDLHWWGAYIGWATGQLGQAETAPVPPPTGDLRPIGFDISWHRNDAEPTNCNPVLLITNLFVTMGKVHEVYVGLVDKSAWYFGHPYYEHQYRYDVDLFDPAVAGLPWPAQEGEQYWINIQAVFPETFIPLEHTGWGWLTTPQTNLCASVFSADFGASWSVDGLPWPHESAGEVFDLAFELTTIDRPATNSPWRADLRIANFTRVAGFNNLYDVASTGDCRCGVQVLQASTNLLQPGLGFRNIQTNRNPQVQNLWRVGTTNVKEFYRVQETD